MLSGQEVCVIMRRHGVALVRQQGSHMVMQRVPPDGTITVPVPNHKELRAGTCNRSFANPAYCRAKSRRDTAGPRHRVWRPLMRWSRTGIRAGRFAHGDSTVAELVGRCNFRSRLALVPFKLGDPRRGPARGESELAIDVRGFVGCLGYLLFLD